VAFEHGKVVVFQGRPDGVLIWNPTVVARTHTNQARPRPGRAASVTERKEFDTKADAVAFVKRGDDAHHTVARR